MRLRLESIRAKATTHKTLIQNFSYLTALQVFNLLLPLVSYPYLIKTLGDEIFGKVIFAQIIVNYFSILIDFGFKISATRQISINRNNNKIIHELISSILVIKIFLWLLSLLTLITLTKTIDFFKKDEILFLASFGVCFYELLFPQWYFQGIEKMKFITIVNLAARSIFTIFVFLFVKKEHDYLLVPLFNGLGALIGGTLGLLIMIKHSNYKLIIPKIDRLKIDTIEAIPLFFSYALISIKDKFSTIIIGSVLGMKYVTIFDAGTKIIGLLMQPIDIITNTLYPRIAQTRNMNLTKKGIQISLIITLMSFTMAQIFLEHLLNFLTIDKENSITVIRILLFIPIIMTFSAGLGRNCLLALGKIKVFSLGMTFTTIFYIAITFILYVLDLLGDIKIFGIITVMTYIFELLYRFYFTSKYKLLKSSL